MNGEDIINYVMETPANSNRAILGSMISQIEGDKLPVVDSEDNGKILTVVEGEWAAAQAGGGGGDSDTVVTYVDATQDPYTSTKTYTELVDAITSGKNVVAVVKASIYDSYDDTYSTEYFNIPCITYGISTYTLQFQNVNISQATNNSIALTTVSISCAPEYNFTGFGKTTYFVTEA